MKDKLDKIGEDMAKGIPPVISRGGEGHENKKHEHDKKEKKEKHEHENPPHRSWSWR